MLTNVCKYDEIIRLTFHIMLSTILSTLAKTDYLAIARIFSTKIFIFPSNVQILKPKSENRFKTECSVHHFRTVFKIVFY